MVVPGRGFLLNNELTDFDFAPATPGVPDPNLPAGGKRPRSSMSPTIVLRNGRPFLATGAAGGATIITTVLGILVNRIDLGMSLPQAIAAPRASQENKPTTQAEPAFIAEPTTPGLEALGQSFVDQGHLRARSLDHDRADDRHRHGARVPLGPPRPRRGGASASERRRGRRPQAPLTRCSRNPAEAPRRLSPDGDLLRPLRPRTRST